MSSKNTKPVKEGKKWMDVKKGNCQERKEIQGFMVVAQVALNAWGPSTYSQTENFSGLCTLRMIYIRSKHNSLLKSVKWAFAT